MSPTFPMRSITTMMRFPARLAAVAKSWRSSFMAAEPFWARAAECVLRLPMKVAFPSGGFCAALAAASSLVDTSNSFHGNAAWRDFTTRAVENHLGISWFLNAIRHTWRQGNEPRRSQEGIRGAEAIRHTWCLGIRGAKATIGARCTGPDGQPGPPARHRGPCAATRGNRRG